MFHQFSYSELDSITLREELSASVKGHKAYPGSDDNRKLSAAVNGVIELYAVYDALLDWERQPARVHHEVSREVGQTLLSWDEESARYSSLDTRIQQLCNEAGISGGECAERATRWLEKLISQRAGDQKTVQSLLIEMAQLYPK